MISVQTIIAAPPSFVRDIVSGIRLDDAAKRRRYIPIDQTKREKRADNVSFWTLPNYQSGTSQDTSSRSARQPQARARAHNY